jgi:cytochrome c oxidase cbb3-type subunit II
MSRSTPLIAGIFGSLAVSVFAMVLVPQAQIGSLSAQATRDDEGKITSVYPTDSVKYGAKVYASEGCIVCHSQQVRDTQNGEDQPRGWGERRTVARDYIFDETPFLGSSRLGPDLANVGAKTWRNEAENDPRRPAKRDAAWHYLHLYKPTAIITESNMPPYPYLFEKRKISGQRSADALPADQVKVEDGYEIVPKTEARELVAYLLSLDRSHPLKEVKSEAPAAAPAAAAPAAK